MLSNTREFYCSSNGDKWFLRYDVEDGRVYVKHVANAPSGGHQRDYEIVEFLGRPGSPERKALLQLIGSLADKHGDQNTSLP